MYVTASFLILALIARPIGSQPPPVVFDNRRTQPRAVHDAIRDPQALQSACPRHPKFVSCPFGHPPLPDQLRYGAVTSFSTTVALRLTSTACVSVTNPNVPVLLYVWVQSS